VADLLIIRAAFVLILAGAAYFLQPFGLASWTAFALGAVFAAALVVLEIRLARASLKKSIGAAIGSLFGILGGSLMSLAIGEAAGENNATAPFLQTMALLFMTYLGIVLGSKKGDLLNASAFGGLFSGEKPASQAFKILDTSVIIDGRLLDIAESGFLEGVVVIPQFVLRELQLVADSSDGMKRNRGRRGLEILQRIQNMPQLGVRILDDDFPNVREVDLKLIELAKVYSSKIVTNDFNLNKVAVLHGVEVLNINELAHALKPVVLPGESMRVFILKEGKEHNQGVAYLDDGTMVVVDNARRMMSKTIDVIVTSVLQTTAGKMIFGRYDEKGPSMADKPQPSEQRARSESQRAHAVDPSPV
jgi:uncharacterized protein YacL